MGMVVAVFIKILVFSFLIMRRLTSILFIHLVALSLVMAQSSSQPGAETISYYDDSRAFVDDSYLLESALENSIERIYQIYDSSFQVINGYAEREGANLRQGFALGHVNLYGHEYGVFFEQTIARNLFSEEDQLKDGRDNIFVGGYISVPYWRPNKSFLFKMNLRAGMVGQSHFLVVPATIIDYRVGRNVHLSAGVGLRGFKATQLFNVIFVL